MKNLRHRNPFNGLEKDQYLELTKPAAVNYVLQDGGNTAVIDIDGYIGRDIIREWITGEKSENTVQNIKNTLREISPEKIIVNINSPGGDLNDGLVIADMLRSKRAEVVTNIMGFSASAATVIGQAGTTRRMSENAFYLMHRVMFGVMGYINQNTTKELTTDMEVIDNRLISFFADRASIGSDEIANLMDDGGGYGRWINADDALEYGFIDEIYDPSDADDENIDHMDADDRTNRMQNIQKLNGISNNGDSLTATITIDTEPIEKILNDFMKEMKGNSGNSASAQIRQIETYKRKR